MTTLDVVTGFLGAGKTTFLTSYAAYLDAQRVSYCIIENEFGQAGIDGDYLKGKGARVREISGGCVCCTLKVTLHDMLLAMAGQVERIILEPSGIFCGDDLLDILSSPALAEKVQLGLWCGIVDPLCVDLMDETDVAVLKSELEGAGSVLLSKTQLATPDERIRALALVARLLPNDPPNVYDCVWTHQDASGWFPQLQADGAILRHHARVGFDHAGMFQSTTLSTDQPVNASAAQHIMDRLMSGQAGQVLRVKGTLPAADCTMWRVNCTPGSITLEIEPAAPPHALNIIGRKLSRASLRQMLGMASA